MRWSSVETTAEGPELMGLCVAVLLKDANSRSELEALLEGQPGLQLRAVGAGGLQPEEVVELNPALQRQARQRQMATWLLPFGFGAGMLFTFITNLDTFAFAGPLGQPLIGGLLGLGSGWMGSYAAAASVTSDRDDQVRTVRNRLNEGQCVLLLDAVQSEAVPWALIQRCRPSSVVRLKDD